MPTEKVPEFRGRWELAAPESYALLHGPKHEYGTEACRLALVELIARDKISFAEREKRGSFGRRSVAFLAPGKDCRRPASRSLAALLDLFDATRDRESPNADTDGVPAADLIRAVRKSYGWPGGYTEAEVMPALEARGLCGRRNRKFPIPFVRPGWEPTASGRRAKDELEDLMSLGYRWFDTWVDEDPEQALRFLGFAGSATLLMRPLHRAVDRLLTKRTPEDPPVPYEVLVERQDVTEIEAARLCLDSDSHPDLGVFEGLDTAFHAIGHELGDAGGSHGGGS